MADGGNARSAKTGRDESGADPTSAREPAGDRSTISLPARRVATWVLLALGALLVVDAPPVRFEPGVDVVRGRDEGAAQRRAVRAALEAHLRDRRSTLSSQETDRVVEAVLRSSRRHGLDPYLVTAVLIVESDARPWAESGKGAIGLMQIMPYMAEDLPLAGNLATIESNVEAGCYILADNIRRLGEAKGISSYFWGRRIRGVAYLRKVQQARQRVREASAS